MQTAEMDLYPSRVTERATIARRRDPVLHGEASGRTRGPLTDKQLAAYAKDGFLMLEGYLDAAEVRHLQAELHAALEAARTSSDPEVIHEPESDAVRSIFAVHRGGAWKQLADDQRLRGAAEQILGSEVYVHQSRINFKPGFEGKDFYWHSDFETWHVEDGMARMRAASFSVLLDDNTIYNGPLMLIPGSHEFYVACVGRTPDNHYQQSLRKQQYGVPDHESLSWLYRKGGIAVPTGPAGSVLVFECNTMHGSSSNISPLSRRNVFLVYNSVENALQPPFGGTRPRPDFIATRAGMP